MRRNVLLAAIEPWVGRTRIERREPEILFVRVVDSRHERAEIHALSELEVRQSAVVEAGVDPGASLEARARYLAEWRYDHGLRGRPV